MDRRDQNVRSHIDKKDILGKWRLIKIIISIRCWSCSKPIGHLWESFKERVANGEEKKKVLDDLKLERYCCRAMFLGHVDLIDMAAQFKKF